MAVHVRKKHRSSSTVVPAGTVDQVALVWRSSRHWAAAFVVALFPFVFIVDEAVETSLSPVLPGVIVLVVLVIGLPFLVNEVAVRRLRRLSIERRPAIVLRYQTSARLATVVAVTWFLAWLALGA